MINGTKLGFCMNCIGAGYVVLATGLGPNGPELTVFACECCHGTGKA